MAYRVWGDPAAPPLLLLHGLGSDGASWGGTVPAFADTWRVYAPDLRGHGRSSRPGLYSCELMRDDVLGFMDVLGLQRASWVGHSLGALVAYLVARHCPERVGRLVLEEMPPPVPLGLPEPQRPEGPIAFDWEVRPAIVGQLNAPDADWWDGIATVGVPTLVVAGGTESHLPQDRIAEMAQRFPAGHLLTIPVGHEVHGALPSEFGEVVRSFLSASR